MIKNTYLVELKAKVESILDKGIKDDGTMAFPLKRYLFKRISLMIDQAFLNQDFN